MSKFRFIAPLVAEFLLIVVDLTLMNCFVSVVVIIVVVVVVVVVVDVVVVVGGAR